MNTVEQNLRGKRKHTAGQRRITATMVLGHETKPVNVQADETVLVDFTVKPL